MASLELPFGIKVLNPTPVDAKYLNDGAVYASIAEVNSTIATGIRHVGLTVNIGYSEYWYASGVTDLDLILKQSASGSTVNGAQNVGGGFGVYSGTTTSGLLNLRSLIGSGNTDVSISGDTLVVHSIDSTALQSNILEFSTVGQTYQPYSDFTGGTTFYLGSTNPTGLTRLNLNAYLNVTEIRLSPDNSHIPTHEIGDLYWDVADSTVSLQQTTDVKQQIGQELYVKAYNSGATTILNGSAVYISGSFGGRPTIRLARASSTDGGTIDEVIGLVTEDIPASQTGFVTTSGLVRDMVTTGFTEGDIAYLSPVTAGALTNVRPTFPDFAIEMGIITNVHLTTGSTYVRIANVTVPTAIRGVEDVSITTFSASTTSDFLAAYANRYIYLPIAPKLGQQITIADSNGDASSFTITIYGNGKNISGTSYLTPETEAVINTDWGSLTLVYNGTFWSIISSVS